MNSDNQTDIYAEFESEANEIMFGQTTLPDRPLTDKESSKRRKIILKLLDQKLKFQLIELMAQQQKQMPTVPIPTGNHDKNIDSNMGARTAASSAVSTNFEYTQNVSQFHLSSEYLQQNRQLPYENVWQPPIYPQHYERNASWYPHANNCQPNFQTNETSLVSVNQLPSTSLQKSHLDSTIQFNHLTTNKENKASLPCKQPLSTDTELFEESKIKSESINNDRQCSKHTPIDLNSASSSQEGIQSKNLLEPPSAPLLKCNDSSHELLRRRKRRKCNSLEDFQIKTLLIQQSTEAIEPNDVAADEADSKLDAIDPNAASSSSQEGIQSKNLLEPPSAPLLKSNDSSHGRLRRRKRRRCNSLEDFQIKNLLIQQSTEAIEPNDDVAADKADSKLKAIDPNAASSSWQEGIQSKNLLEPPSATLLKSNDSSHGRLRKRKRRRCNSLKDSPIERLLIQQPTEATEPNTVTGDEGGSKLNAASVVNMPGNNSSVNIDIEKTNSTQCFRNVSTEWKMLNQLVTVICHNELNHLEPISPAQLKQHNQILLQMSIYPTGIRSNSTVVQKVSKEKLKKFINECSVILFNISLAGPQIKSNFTESKNELIADLKALVPKQDTSNKALKSISVETKIKAIINPFLCSGEKNHELVNKLLKNPYSLEDNEVIKNRIASKNQSVDDVMRQIKGVLDSCITARQPKTFHFTLSHCVDVPFVVNLFNKSGKMSKKYATKLQGTLRDSINCLKIHPKPILRDITFSDGSLKIVCINRMSFEWLEKTISEHLSVNILPFKNVISKNGLKTICVKFQVPQYYHFNNLMERLKVDNPLLLTRRWELRSSQHKNVDSTKCIYVGVDVDSLIKLEQMNRVGNLRGSSVYFEISYDDNEENFERMNFVEKTSTKRSRRRKYKSVGI